MAITAKNISATKSLAKNLCSCNYSGDCILLDCPCVIQNSHFSLTEGKVLCKYFRDNVLPSDPHLSAIFGGFSGRYINCKICGATVAATGRRTKYCDKCSAAQRRKNKAKWHRENYAQQTQSL